MRLPRGASASPKGTVSPFESLCPSGRDKQSFPSGCLSPVSLAVPACTCSAGGTRMRLPPGQLPSTRLASLGTSLWAHTQGQRECYWQFFLLTLPPSLEARPQTG